MAQIEESVARYLEQLDTADRQEPSEALTTKTNRLKEKIETLKEQMRRLELLKVTVITGNLKFRSVFPANREDAPLRETAAAATTAKKISFVP